MIAQAEVGPNTVMPMHSTSIDTVEDMSSLADLHEGAILYNIQMRYKKNNIYTYIGSILSAVNPYQVCCHHCTPRLVHAC